MLCCECGQSASGRGLIDDNPSDMASLLDLLTRHRERLRPLQPDTTETRLLQFPDGGTAQHGGREDPPERILDLERDLAALLSVLPEIYSCVGSKREVNQRMRWHG